ncbi:MAG: hypothetical protein R3264_10215, partial [Anaerolineae bacterium]|nr:hypothetical protein [Anaerolineae bacterium]
MNPKLIEPQTDPLWQKLVEQQPSDVFHSPAWLRVLAETYPIKIRACVLLDKAEEPVGGIPFGQISDDKGSRLVTLPFSDYCDPVAGSDEQWQALATRLLAETPAFTIRCLHNRLPLADQRFTVVNKAKWHGLDFQDDLDTLWAGIHSSARRAIKKARREAVTVQAARSKKELRQFFELHLGVRKNKYRLLAQPYRFFENIWDNFVAKGN